MYTLHKNQILMEYIFLSKQIVGFSNTTHIVGFSNGDDSEDFFLTKTLTNMKYPPNVIHNWYPRLTLEPRLHREMAKLCVCVCVFVYLSVCVCVCVFSVAESKR